MALPSSRIFTPSLIIGKMQRSRISSSLILRGLAPDLTMKSLMTFSVKGLGLATRFSS